MNLKKKKKVSKEYTACLFTTARSTKNKVEATFVCAFIFGLSLRVLKNEKLRKKSYAIA